MKTLLFSIQKSNLRDTIPLWEYTQNLCSVLRLPSLLGNLPLLQIAFGIDGGTSTAIEDHLEDLFFYTPYSHYHHAS